MPRISATCDDAALRKLHAQWSAAPCAPYVSEPADAAVTAVSASGDEGAGAGATARASEAAAPLVSDTVGLCTRQLRWMGQFDRAQPQYALYHQLESEIDAANAALLKAGSVSSAKVVTSGSPFESLQNDAATQRKQKAAVARKAAVADLQRRLDGLRDDIARRTPLLQQWESDVVAAWQQEGVVQRVLPTGGVPITHATLRTLQWLREKGVLAESYDGRLDYAHALLGGACRHSALGLLAAAFVRLGAETAWMTDMATLTAATLAAHVLYLGQSQLRTNHVRGDLLLSVLLLRILQGWTLARCVAWLVIAVPSTACVIDAVRHAYAQRTHRLRHEAIARTAAENRRQASASRGGGPVELT